MVAAILIGGGGVIAPIEFLKIKYGWLLVYPPFNDHSIFGSVQYLS